MKRTTRNIASSISSKDGSNVLADTSFLIRVQNESVRTATEVRAFRVCTSGGTANSTIASAQMVVIKTLVFI